MREIKFRGKHIHAFIEPHNTGIWVYGYLCNDHYINSEELMGEMLVDKDTVGQYTGLKDKNGKEIYEGDIVKTKYNKKDFLVWIEYSEEYAQFVTRCKENILDNEPLGDLYESRIEVIGDIYDNENLLKE